MYLSKYLIIHVLILCFNTFNLGVSITIHLRKFVSSFSRYSTVQCTCNCYSLYVISLITCVTGIIIKTSLVNVFVQIMYLSAPLFTVFVLSVITPVCLTSSESAFYDIISGASPPRSEYFMI